MVSHVLNPGVRAVLDRLRREAPPDHDVRMILSADDPAAPLAGLAEADVERISRADIEALGYPVKCRGNWVMDGNLDAVFLEFRRRRPQHGHYWFVEYDVHWEGEWRVFFERFRGSPSGLVGATMQHMDEVPHKEHQARDTKLVVPPGLPWDRPNVIKGFLPICRISPAALDALDRAYRAGLGGHYEFTVPTVTAQAGLGVEDFGGQGRYVRPENLNRFYFANGGSYTHSPGTFVFRPDQRVLPRRNTLWHPVKPGGVPAWHPLRVKGGPAKSALERLKPYVWQAANRLWFATRWRPLRE